MVGFNLDGREVHQIAFREDFTVLLQHPAESGNRQVGVRHKLLRRHQFLGQVIDIVTDGFGLFPRSAVRESNLDFRDIPETLDILEDHVLLVKGIEETVVPAEPCKLQVFFEDTKAQRMKRADIHLVDVRHNPSV